jgi:hypothetical protein
MANSDDIFGYLYIANKDLLKDTILESFDTYSFKNRSKSIKGAFYAAVILPSGKTLQEQLKTKPIDFTVFENNHTGGRSQDITIHDATVYMTFTSPKDIISNIQQNSQDPKSLESSQRKSKKSRKTRKSKQRRA